MNIDVPLVRELIEAQFPQWAKLAIEPVVPGGWDNRTFRLGPDMSIRLPSAERYAAQVTKEQEWLPRLAPRLPLPIPAPIAMGAPHPRYPWHWSIHSWLEGDIATTESITDIDGFARSLAKFLRALWGIDSSDGPAAGPHNFFRGGPLAHYDAETRDAIAALRDEAEAREATQVWEAALDTPWRGPTVWLHGDVSPSNLLVRDGALAAVIDFGSMGVGDPACDLAIAWTFFSKETRRVFRAACSLDDETWARGRAWALWKALITG